jgi:L-fuculose-phosphate aldolase
VDAGELTHRRGIVEVCRSFEARRLGRGTAGNVSVRHGDGFLVTPSALPYADMGPADVCWVGHDGRRRGDRPPSSEWRFHAAVYRHRPDAGAVVHLHSPYATALACLEEPLPPFHYMVAAAGGDDVRCAPYARFGSDDLAGAVLDALTGRKAALLAHHGQIALGADLDDALAVAVVVEDLAEQYLHACTVRRPPTLDVAEMAAVVEHFDRYRRGELDRPAPT